MCICVYTVYVYHNHVLYLVYHVYTLEKNIQKLLHTCFHPFFPRTSSVWFVWILWYLVMFCQETVIGRTVGICQVLRLGPFRCCGLDQGCAAEEAVDPARNEPIGTSWKPWTTKNACQKWLRFGHMLHKNHQKFTESLVDLVVKAQPK